MSMDRVKLIDTSRVSRLLSSKKHVTVAS